MNANRPPRSEKPTSSEVKSGSVEGPGVQDFRESLIALEFALRNNPNSGFVPNEWLNDTTGNSDSAVYARMLDELNTSDEQKLSADQTLVLSYIQSQVDYHTKRVELPALPDALVGQAAAEFGAKLTALQANAESDDHKSRMNVPIKGAAVTAAVMQNGGNNSSSGKLSEFVTTFDESPDEPKAKSARNNFRAELIKTRYMTATFERLAKELNEESKGPSLDQPEAITFDQRSSEILELAEEKLSTLRDELAAMYARREKRIWGIDAYKGEAVYGAKYKKLYEDYQRASREVFVARYGSMISSRDVSRSDKIMKIAKYTASEGRQLDEATLASFRDKNTRFGKLLEKYGDANIVAKILLGVGASALAGFATGGVGTFAVSGSLMAAGFSARARKKRREGADKFDFDSEQLAADFLEDGGGDTPLYEQLDAAHGAMDLIVKRRFDERVDKAQKRTLRTTLGSYAAAGVIGGVTHNLPGDWLNGQDGFLHHSAHVDNFDYGTPSIEAPHVVGLDQIPGQHVLELHTGASDVFAHSGMGMYEAAHHAGFSISQSDLLRAAPELYKHGLAYVMPDGLPGIPNPGQMPQATIDILRYFATNH